MTKTKKNQVIDNQKNKSYQSRLIAVGASAGGLEALKSFFSNLPDNDINSYIVIQHLSPDYKSMMAELLSKTAKLPIEEIHDNSTVEPGKIYLIPPINNLTIEDGILHLTEKPKNQKLNLPIDIFLDSLADYKKDQAIALILSGTGSDGTRGIKAIKENDGMVMVQDPREAKFDGMPKSAINSGMVDYILPVEEMGVEIHSYIKADISFSSHGDLESYDEKVLSKILNYIDENTGLDFREYKTSTLARRITRRVNVCKCKTLKEYYHYLQTNPDEVSVLFKEFLIGVTKFYRDPRVWQILKEDIIPELIETKEDGEILKIWDVACSTGEEAYSLAIYIYEEIQRQNKKIEVKIFATDIAKQHLEIGGNGMYSESMIADIDSQLLNRYFIKKPEGYQVIEKIRRMVIFSQHNIIKNPPFSNMDMVFCRNLLIYFQQSIQKKALNVLHYSLKEKGFLILGTSETVNSHRENFEEISRKWKIYRNILPRKRLNSTNLKPNSKMNVAEKRSKRTESKSSNPLQKFTSELNEAILDQFGGASVFIDEDTNILEAVGEFRKYANLPVKGFTTKLNEMLDVHLQHILQSCVKKAKKDNQKIIYRNATYTHLKEKKALDLIVKPFIQHNLDGEINYVITFLEKNIDLRDIEESEKITLDSRTQEYILDLENELKRTKEELHTSMEEIETSNEELQNANEELLASNEELQSTNEELQSVNEEINTVNAENIQKMDDLSELNADMNNILESTDIGVIFLDSQLRIRKFTPAIKKHFSLINSDTGRPIDNFVTNFGKNRGRGLVSRCKKSMETGKTLERNIVSKEGRNYLRRISPFIDSQNNIDGVVITFVDIESLQRAKDKLVASEKRFKSFYEEDPVMHFSIDPNTSEILQCNEEAILRLGYDEKEEIIGRPIYDLYDDKTKLKVVQFNKVLKEEGELKHIEMEMLTKKGEKVPIILYSNIEYNEKKEIVTNRLTCVDVSELKTVQEKLKEQKADLQRANKDLEQFVSICSHDLQEPLATIKFGSDVLGKLYADKLDDKGKSYISYIDEASDRLANQIKDLLEHSRIGRNTKKTLVDTKELAEVVRYDLTKRIKDTQAKISIGSLPKIKAYKVELRLLLQNLMSNALKYVDKNRKPEIRISAYPQDDYWVFSVMDNGIGISEEDQKNIFTIFSRVPTEDKYEGTGVGLAHVEKIVQLHEGSIWVDSQKGVGSTFYFKIKA
ncbi:CheR family methyltransferase [Mesonia aestuariivivens]|uniref:histidine kinase n=1 Tax=Mesonia aestuariivivens TaxID=2796128 RepID=A0ABS6W1M3_9FLAO|nr:CheR family methyltransferase [Mesonia aestuariivivens]MBW2961750.1 PAS domain-containing protein [Mesonia aestuariivivens]